MRIVLCLFNTIKNKKVTSKICPMWLQNTLLLISELSKLCKVFCKENVNIKLVFTTFKIENYFSYKDPIPNDLNSPLVYKFTCASCSSSYIGKTCCHFKTMIEEHIKKDKKSHIFKPLHSTSTCVDSYNSLSFKIIDKANSKFDLRIKESLHINRRKPNLNAQQNHYLSPFRYSFRPPCSFLFCFCVSLWSIIFIIFDTHYWHLLLS